MATTSWRSAGDWTRLFGLIAIWGTAFLFIDLSVATLPPATLVATRVGIAAVVLVAALRPLRLTLPAPGPLWLRFLLLACVGNAIPFLAISWGQQRVASGSAGILMAVMPLATLVLAHFFVAGERMQARKTTGFAMGFGGVVLLTGPDALSRIGGAPSDIVYQLAILTGALCYAINTILAQRMPAMHPAVSSACVMIMATLVMLPTAIFVDRPWELEPSGLSIASVVWLGLVPTGAATVLYFRIVSSAGPTFLSLMNYVIPGVALVTGMIVLQEPFAWRVLGALALILAGLFTSQTGPQTASPPLRAPTG
jgi:drug/metabolite transporter (DMT)-like permease